MKFNEKYPDHPIGRVVNENMLVSARSWFCVVCGASTRFISIVTTKRVCSDECTYIHMERIALAAMAPIERYKKMILSTLHVNDSCTTYELTMAIGNLHGEFSSDMFWNALNDLQVDGLIKSGPTLDDKFWPTIARYSIVSPIEESEIMKNNQMSNPHTTGHYREIIMLCLNNAPDHTCTLPELIKAIKTECGRFYPTILSTALVTIGEKQLIQRTNKEGEVVRYTISPIEDNKNDGSVTDEESK